MLNLKKTFALVAFIATLSFAGNHDPAAIISLMPGAKISLIKGIELAEAASGVAVSAKFEVGDDGKLVLFDAKRGAYTVNVDLLTGRASFAR